MYILELATGREGETIEAASVPFVYISHDVEKRGEGHALDPRCILAELAMSSLRSVFEGEPNQRE
jgi:hypothetical protein